SPIQIAAVAGPDGGKWSYLVTASWNGSQHLATWSDPNGIHVARITADGTLLDPGGVLAVTAKPGEALVRARSVWNGKHWVLAWYAGPSNVVWGSPLKDFPVWGATESIYALRLTSTLGAVDVDPALVTD